MIPKIIHYCWLSKDPYPDKIQKCIDSWKTHLPDYEIWLWDFNRFDIDQSIWVKEAYEAKKYAFAADYIRFFALYNYGGIYLDSDVEVLKSFDDLLELPYFFGQEDTSSAIEAATMGCEKGFPLMGEMLDKYQGRHFVRSDGKLDCHPLPGIIKEHIDTFYQLKIIPDINSFGNDKSIIYVFPDDWFSPKSWDAKTMNITTNTYSIHHFSGTWLEWDAQLMLRHLWFSKKFPKIYFYFLYLPIYELKKYHIIK